MKKIIILIISLFLINKTTYGQQVTIGTQIWQTTNLNVSTYSDGTPIPQITDSSEWRSSPVGAWCYYDNITANGTTYGKLYNWHAVVGIHNAASVYNLSLRKQLAPAGWHIPTDAEWTTLISYLGGSSVVGGKMKATSFTGNNLSGFTALPGGYRYDSGTFNEVGQIGQWWRSIEFSAERYYSIWLSRSSSNASAYTWGDKNAGYSVRCISDSSLSNTTFETNSLKLHPNPAESFLNINIDSNLINQPYSIIDGLGRVVLYGKLNQVNTTLNVEYLSKGVYFIKVSGYSASKFIKE